MSRKRKLIRSDQQEQQQDAVEAASTELSRGQESAAGCGMEAANESAGGCLPHAPCWTSGTQPPELERTNSFPAAQCEVLAMAA